MVLLRATGGPGGQVRAFFCRAFIPSLVIVFFDIPEIKGLLVKELNARFELRYRRRHSSTQETVRHEGIFTSRLFGLKLTLEGQLTYVYVPAKCT